MQPYLFREAYPLIQEMEVRGSKFKVKDPGPSAPNPTGFWLAATARIRLLDAAWNLAGVGSMGFRVHGFRV